MITMEVHPGEGGADAAAFAFELASAVAKHSDTTAELVGGAYRLNRL